MDEKIRNTVLAVAALIVAIAYSYSAVTTSKRTNDYYNRLDQARSECGKEGENSTQERRYEWCMRYKGFDIGHNR